VARPLNPPLKALKNSIPSRSGLLVAVSGGMDSVCLLDCCFRLQDRLRLKLEVAHVDHALRPESQAEASFVGRLAEKYGLPFHLKRAATPPARGENQEAWGRRLRYSFFSHVRRRRDLDFVLTAHTANDVAETLLMRLVSNKEPATIQAFDEKRRLIRPFLGVSREEISRYVTERALEFRDDLSNQDRTYLRNRVRHELLPVIIRHFDPRAIETLSERAAALASDIKALYGLLEKPLVSLSGAAFGSREWLRALRAELSMLDPALGWRLVERAFRDKLGFSLGRRHALRLHRFIIQRAAGIELPGGVSVRRRQGGLVLELSYK